MPIVMKLCRLGCREGQKQSFKAKKEDKKVAMGGVAIAERDMLQAGEPGRVWSGAGVTSRREEIYQRNSCTCVCMCATVILRPGSLPSFTDGALRPHAQLTR